MKLNLLESTVVCETLSQFLEDAVRVGYCFRCGVPVNPSADEWANIAQVMRPFNIDVVIGGLLCKLCVGSWREWLQEEAPRWLNVYELEDPETE